MATLAMLPVAELFALFTISGGILVAGTAALWAYYGTTVFFEVVRTGWVACF